MRFALIGLIASEAALAPTNRFTPRSNFRTIIKETAEFAEGGRDAHPDDVIIGKLRYFHEGGSDTHLRDIAGMLLISDHLFDCDNIRRWAEKLGVTEAWDAVLGRLAKE